ncbi:MAG: DUF6364 family protein [bacterium]
MKNVTITLEDDVAQWARVWAAKKNASVSSLLGKLLKEKMQQEEGYEIAMKQYLSTPETALKSTTENYPRRDSLYER